MNPDRKPLRLVMVAELLAFGFALYLLNRDSMPRIGLSIQRAAYISCQQAARAFGVLAIELENSYRVKVAP
jgi:hypothetical protein